jgi:DNA-binding transcriptional MerR regulator/copper chaperone CopZ
MSMTIAHAAQAAGVGVETIRFYERRGLIARPRKPANGGFRQYDAETVARIRFVRQAQELGFSLREIEDLLSLRADPQADCAEVRAQAITKRDEVEQKIVQLQRIRAALETLVASCPGSGALRACTILDAIDHVQTEQSGAQPAHAKMGTTNKSGRPPRVTKTANLVIEGMRCDGCARTVKALIGAKTGVHQVEVSLATRRARILYDPTTVTKESIATTIKKGGFRVKVRAS